MHSLHRGYAAGADHCRNTLHRGRLGYFADNIIFIGQISDSAPYLSEYFTMSPALVTFYGIKPTRSGKNKLI